MKKILLPVLLTLAVASCIKKDAAVSTTVTTSYPTITISSGKYYSVLPNAIIAPTNVTASVTDSFYNPCTLVVVDSAIHTNIPGLYVGTVTAKNSEGFISYASFYVAVTNISTAVNLAGTWWPAGATTSDSAAYITELANGLYRSSNLGGIADTSSSVTSGIFAVTNTTTIVFPADNPDYVSPGSLSMIPTDTTISYTSAVTGAVITYKKQ